MASVNKVILVGNLGQDPEVKYMPSGGAVANVSIATSDRWKDKQTGEQRERTEWHRLVFFNRLAEIVGGYLQKGSAVYVEGRLQTRKWQGQDGQDRYTTEIVVNEMQMLGGRGGGQSGGSAQFGGGQQQQRSAPRPQQQGQQQPGGPAPAPNYDGPGDDFDDDIPF